MQELILGILKEIELDKEYAKLCERFCDFDNSANLNKKEVDPIIKSFDSGFKYIARDRTFMKETAFEEYTVRFFIGFKSGIVDFGYLVWKEGDNNNFYKGDLQTLSKEVDAEFEGNVRYSRPLATSLEDFKEILSKYFELFESFKQHFQEAVQS
ncbi:hypothetical protein [Marinoscillum furvescens]|uniref:Uncharacterized protein n=1 Tax=Marinoscillum furvescens DSM 4134 TaxID=1122208 RepID=A0A3D9L633_MARFU|nr:hypothetical protein [Marinoscillum furvescens]REE00544.1 hypothetical protein C7460_105170 [Marinoscillum furvescens DSM 4134]